MSRIDNLLSKITEEYAQGMRMRCDMCGKIAEIQDEGRGPLLCCNKKMIVMAQYTPKMEAGFNKYPRGWSNDSVKKFGKTLSKNMKGGVKSKGFFEKCVNKMRGKVENPEGFCAGVKDETYGSTGWRGKGKSPGKVRADVKKAKFKVEGLDRLLEYEEAYFITQCDKENDRIEDKLLCLKKAYILCGANRVCQQRIDRFYDALTGNFEGSGEAPLQTEPQGPDITTKNENFPDMSGGGGMGCRVPPADTSETEERDEDNIVHKNLPWASANSDVVAKPSKVAEKINMRDVLEDVIGGLKNISELEPQREELNQIIELPFVAKAAIAGAATGGAVLASRAIRKRSCKKKYPNDPERQKRCIKLGISFSPASVDKK